MQNEVAKSLRPGEVTGVFYKPLLPCSGAGKNGYPSINSLVLLYTEELLLQQVVQRTFAISQVFDLPLIVIRLHS